MSQTPKKILILGAGGQLGLALSEVFGSATGYQAAAFDRKALDILNGPAVAAAIHRERPWAVINAAAWTDVDGCEKDIEKAYTVNAIAPGETAAHAYAAGSRFVHVSTDYVFDGFKESPYTEEDDPNPLSIYGKSKLEGERLVLEACPQALILRSSWLFGLGRANFVMRIFESVMAQKGLRVVSDRRGAPTYTRDLAGAVKRLMELDASGLYHVSNQGECSWYEYAAEILKILKVEARLLPVPASEFKRPAPRPEYTVLDNAKYRRATGAALRPWPEALNDFLAHLNTELKPSDLLGT